MTVANGHIRTISKVRYPDFEHGCTGLASSNLRMKPEETVIGNTYRYYFGNGYVRFYPGSTQIPQYYYYTADHLGNIRSVVTKNHSTNEITEVQQTHYYPFGGIIADLSTGRNVQNHLYNGKELDYSNNLYWYDYGARQYDPTAPRFTTPDRYSEKYYSQNMYGYCGNNPMNRIDINGDSTAVLNYEKGVGHSALLIQNDEGKWRYYSMNGTNIYNKTYGIAGGKPYHDLGEKTFESPQDFLSSSYNRPANNEDEISQNTVNNYGYKEAYVLPTTPDQDAKIESAFRENAQKTYSLIDNQCAQVVQKSLNAAGIITTKKVFMYYDSMTSLGRTIEKSPYFPSKTFKTIKQNNPKGILIRK